MAKYSYEESKKRNRQKLDIKRLNQRIAETFDVLGEYSEQYQRFANEIMRVGDKKHPNELASYFRISRQGAGPVALSNQIINDPKALERIYELLEWKTVGQLVRYQQEKYKEEHPKSPKLTREEAISIIKERDKLRNYIQEHKDELYAFRETYEGLKNSKGKLSGDIIDMIYSIGNDEIRTRLTRRDEFYNDEEELPFA